MLIWSIVSIEEKDLFNSYFHKNHYPTEFFNFTSVFIWSKVVRLEYTVAEGFLCMREISPVHEIYRYLMPLGQGDLGHIIRLLQKDAAAQGIELRFEELSQEMVDDLDKAGVNCFSYLPRRDLFEYIYRVEDIANTDNYIIRKRAHSVLRFMRTYSYQYQEISYSHIPSLMDYMCQWGAERAAQIHDDNNLRLLQADVDGVIAVLENFQRLDYFGAFLEIEGQIGALAMITPLNHNTLAGNVLMASNKLFANSSAAMMHLLARNSCGGYEYLNAAEDLGIESLRHYKSSFRPFTLLPKYCTVSKNQQKDKPTTTNGGLE